MTRNRRWQDLSERQRMTIFVGGTFDALMRLIALVDVVRRPRDQLRGPKPLWVILLSLTSSFGALPGAYFLFGRRRS
jgi:hypothetical protein